MNPDVGLEKEEEELVMASLDMDATKCATFPTVCCQVK